MNIEQDFKAVREGLAEMQSLRRRCMGRWMDASEALSRIEGWCNERQGMNDAFPAENSNLKAEIERLRAELAKASASATKDPPGFNDSGRVIEYDALKNESTHD